VSNAQPKNREVKMMLLKYLCLLAIFSLLLGSPIRAEDYNSTQKTLSDVQKKKDDAAKAQIQNMRVAPPKGSTGPTVPPNPVGSTLAAPKLGGSTGPTVPSKPVGTQK
jgi:hypothetical protein